MHLDRNEAGRLRSFRNQLLLLVLLVIIPAFLLVLYGNLQRQQVEKGRARERAVTLAKLAASAESHYVKEARQLLATVAQFQFLVLSTNSQGSEWHFNNLRLLSPDFNDFGLLETNGVVFCNTQTNAMEQAVLPATTRNVLQRHTFALGGFVCSPALREAALQFGYPVRDPQGETVRVIYASVKAPLFSAALEDLPLPEGGVVNVLDARGRIVARAPSRDQSIGTVLKSSEFQRLALQQGEGVFETAELDGVRRLYAVARVIEDREPMLFVAVGIPSRVSFAAANKLLLQSSLVMLFAAGFVLLLARWFAERSFLQPVGAMLQAAKRLTSGDLAARTGISGGKSELHLLAGTFDEMAATLEKREAEIRKNNAELEARVHERTAELETLNAELEAFSYSVSHDLRAPLRHMHGFAQILITDPKLQSDAATVRYLGLITKAAKQMGTLIDDLLSFSRMARQSMMLGAVHSGQFVEQLSRELAGKEADRKIEWKIGALPDVQADASMLRQVWINLISNALKYTRGKEPAVIEISAHEEANEIVFSVRDNGAGFDMAYANKLFGVFQRLHREDEFEGTGIGLANVRRIIHRHGGRTWAEGEVGKGAKFFFSLPKSE